MPPAWRAPLKTAAKAKLLEIKMNSGHASERARARAPAAAGSNRNSTGRRTQMSAGRLARGEICAQMRRSV